MTERAHRLIAPVDEKGINTGKHKYGYGGRIGPDYTFKLPEMLDQIPIKDLAEYKERLTRLIKDLMQTEGVITTFHVIPDCEAQAHGNGGWGYSFQRKDGKFEIVDLYSHSSWSGKTSHLKDKDGVLLKGHGFDENKLLNQPLESFLEKVDDDFSIEINLGNTTISLGNAGAIGNLPSQEKYNPEEKIAIGRSSDYYLLHFSSSGPDANKYLELFEKRLNTFFVKPKSYKK